SIHLKIPLHIARTLCANPKGSSTLSNNRISCSQYDFYFFKRYLINVQFNQNGKSSSLIQSSESLGFSCFTTFLFISSLRTCLTVWALLNFSSYRSRIHTFTGAFHF